jgi:hypothetical protein
MVIDNARKLVQGFLNGFTGCGEKLSHNFHWEEKTSNGNGNG